MKKKELIENIEMFLIDLKLKNLSKNTIINYKSDLNDFLMYVENLDDINEYTIKLYIGELYKRNMAPRSIRRKCACLRQVLKDIFPEFKIKVDKFLPEVLTDEEIIKIQSVIKDRREWIIFNVLLTTGMRISEFSEMNTNDIKPKIKIKGKGNKERMIYLVEKLYTELKDISKDNNPLVQNIEGFRLSQVSIRKILTDIVKRAGIDKKVTPHTLRRTFATRMIQNGVDIKTVQNLLGHESLETTSLYLILADFRTEDEVRKKGKWENLI